MKRAGRLAATALMVVAFHFFSMMGLLERSVPCVSAAFAQAEDGWKSEFEEVCGKTQEAMSMTRQELKSLMERCDKLRPIMQMQEEPARKVYLKRLQMCRDLLAYVYDTKN